MKKILAVLLIIVAIATGAWLILSDPESAVDHGVEISFLEFTNTASGPAALLGVHFGPRFSGSRGLALRPATGERTAGNHGLRKSSTGRIGLSISLRRNSP